MKPMDRETSLDTARINAETLIQHLGLHAEIRNHGSRYGTTSCDLVSKTDKQIKARGAGKGRTEQESFVGALFEALEHYFQAEYHDHIIPIPLSINDYYESKGLCDIPFSIISQQKNKKIATLNYQSCHPGQDDLLIPFAISNPFYLVSPQKQAAASADDFNYSALSKYSSTNGMSVGSTLNEALIHSICENIERMCLGEFLTSTIGMSRPHGIKLINKQTLPEHIQEMTRYAEALIKSEICIIDITNEFNVPACLAYINSDARYERQFGLGCSIYPELAVIRAVTEVLQLRVYSNHEEYNQQLIIQENKKEFTQFEEDEYYGLLSILRVGDLLRQGDAHIEHVNFQPNENNSLLPDLETHKQLLLHKVEEYSSCFLYTHYFEDSQFNFSCINGFILPMDNSFLLSKGVKVSLPNTHLQRMTI